MQTLKINFTFSEVFQRRVKVMPFIKSQRSFALVVLLVVFVIFIEGCTLMKLRGETRLLEKVGVISGEVEGQTVHGKPIVVVLLGLSSENSAQPESLMGKTILKEPGPFIFYAGDGTFRVSAFVDTNEDGRYQVNESVGWHDQPDVINLDGGGRVENLHVNLRPPYEVMHLYPEVSNQITDNISDYSKRFSLGVQANLGQKTFVKDYGRMAFWEPLRFIETGAGGIFFLEPYTPEKTPILFIHGAGGQPDAWRTIVDRLDRKRFQPWMLFYPSGLRLDINRQWVANGLTELQQTFRFDNLIIVAHSMGGLLAGGVVVRLCESGHGDMVEKLITLSTPWGGHEFAAAGVARSPAVIPAWFDMVPGSDYQMKIFVDPWPPNLIYHLFFSYRGGFNVFAGSNTDGVISISSQLLPAAQERAASIRGFDEDHTSILTSAAVIERLNNVLKNGSLR